MLEDVNIIFLGIGGVLDTFHLGSNEQIEAKVKLLSDILMENNAKVVITSGCRGAINEETLEIDHECGWVLFLFYLFDKYNIEVYGRTKFINKYLNNDKHVYIESWKEDEIRVFLFTHSEIAHYCVLDCDYSPYLNGGKSDLDKVRSHLVTTKYSNDLDNSDEGLMPYHAAMIKEVLSMKNDYRKVAYRRLGWNTKYFYN